MRQLALSQCHPHHPCTCIGHREEKSIWETVAHAQHSPWRESITKQPNFLIVTGMATFKNPMHDSSPYFKYLSCFALLPPIGSQLRLSKLPLAFNVFVTDLYFLTSSLTSLQGPAPMQGHFWVKLPHGLHGHASSCGSCCPHSPCHPQENCGR